MLTTLPAEVGYLFNLEVFGLEGNPILDPNLQHHMLNPNPISIVPFLRDHVLSKRLFSLPLILFLFSVYRH